ncbi:MAG TPA: hypothetical protein VGL70_22085 [Candidatus Binatia bacterium]
MPSQKIWQAVLQCYDCNRIFTLSGLLTDQLSDLQLSPLCPHCKAKPILDPGGPSKSKLHHLVDLREEKKPN